MAENNWGFLPGDSNLSYFTLTPTLTTEPPINRAFQANCEGVRVEKEKSFFYFISMQPDKFLCKRVQSQTCLSYAERSRKS